MAALRADESGYREVVRRKDQQQMVAFLHQVLRRHALQVPGADLERLARQHLKVPSSYEELLRDLGGCSSAGADAAQALRGVQGVEVDMGNVQTQARFWPDLCWLDAF